MHKDTLWMNECALHEQRISVLRFIDAVFPFLDETSPQALLLLQCCPLLWRKNEKGRKNEKADRVPTISRTKRSL